ncbi:MAG: preprotein translocase subunit SecG [Alphaproteobacteria bacterium]|nr:preprotein translocase subunit SecG [Alphaproteobacteria bacterium]
MELVLTVVHLLIALALVGVVLVQRSEGGGLGLGGGGSGGMGGFMTARGTANLLTRTTAILAAAFMVTSLTLAILAGGHSRRAPAVMDGPIPTAPAAPAVPAAPAPPVAR